MQEPFLLGLAYASSGVVGTGSSLTTADTTGEERVKTEHGNRVTVIAEQNAAAPVTAQWVIYRVLVTVSLMLIFREFCIVGCMRMFMPVAIRYCHSA